MHYLISQLYYGCRWIFHFVVHLFCYINAFRYIINTGPAPSLPHSHYGASLLDVSNMKDVSAK